MNVLNIDTYCNLLNYGQIFSNSLSVRLFPCLSLSLFLSVCLSVSLFLSVCLSVCPPLSLALTYFLSPFLFISLLFPTFLSSSSLSTLLPSFLPFFFTYSLPSSPPSFLPLFPLSFLSSILSSFFTIHQYNRFSELSISNIQFGLDDLNLKHGNRWDFRVFIENRQTLLYTINFFFLFSFENLSYFMLSGSSIIFPSSSYFPPLHLISVMTQILCSTS